MPAPKGNTNAAKPEEEKLSSVLYVRCTKAQKALWAQAAYPNKVNDWVTKVLTKAEMEQKQ